MKHPFVSIPRHKRAAFFVPLLILTLGTMVALNYLGQPLQTDAAPAGIISYEFAGDVATAQDILDSWNAIAKIFAGFNLGLDYLFLVAYSTTIALAIVWISGGLSGSKGLLTLAIALAWAQWFAAVLDAVENAALLIMLVDNASSPWPKIAFWCATLKFSIVGLGLLFVTVAVVLRLLARVRHQ